MKWSQQEESILEMKNILLAKPKIAHHPLLRLKLWQDNKKKKNDDHNLTAVLRRGGGEGIAQWILGGGLMDYRMVSDGYTGRARVEVGRKLIFVDCFSQ